MEWIKEATKQLNEAKIKVVDIDLEAGTINYSDRIKQHRLIKFIKGDEEIVRAFLVNRLVNDLDYKPELIELEKEYNIGRPKVSKARIDLILRDNKNNSFLFIEVKAPDAFEADKNYIEGQLYQLAKLEGNVKYLVYYTLDLQDFRLVDRAIVIDFEKYPEYADWSNAGFPSIGDELRAGYHQPQKPPLVKGDPKYDLRTNFTSEEISGLAKNLHDFLWGGGGTSDTEIFYSLVNTILAKIQDESEKENGEQYDFQIFRYGDSTESPEKVFERINALYRRALKEQLNITDERIISKSYVINEEKFPVNKLIYTVQTLENYSLIEGRSSLNGRDILGDFFERITRDGFKQTKGQFFTPINIVRFVLYVLELDNLAINKLNKDKELPYIIDPACGSGTFLIEAMKLITKEVKYKRKTEISSSRQVQDRFLELFTPDYRENRWAREFIYGADINFDLGTSAKVNMILHGDGSTNIFVKDGLLPFRFYDKDSAPNYLKIHEKDKLYADKDVNAKFDVVVSNPPFSVDLDNETKRFLNISFLFGEKKNSENLFVERWYQLLREGGRLGVVLPESVYDTTENKYIRLFLFKYFKIKVVVSLPQLTFEPFTSTKTSLLFAQKKTTAEVEAWNALWNKCSAEWGQLKTRVENYINVFIKAKPKDKYPSIREHNEETIRENIFRFLKDYLAEDDKKLGISDILKKYNEEVSEISTYDTDMTDFVGFCNVRWVFSEVTKEQPYRILMCEAENVGYKRTRRRENPMPNDLFKVDKDVEVIINTDNPSSLLDHIRKAQIWE
jgi:type I restriction enzyme M protein